MVEERKAPVKRHPFQVLAIFAFALTLQGMNLVVFQGDRPASKVDERSRNSAWMTGEFMASNVFTVTTLEDGGPGSLRQAIIDANENPGLDQIFFDFNEPVTITVFSPLIITDPLDVEASGPWITHTNPGFITVDGSNVPGNLFVITETIQTSFRRLRITNVNDGFGFQIVGGLGGNEIISNTILNSFGGVQLQNSSQITMTNNVFLNMSEIGVQAMNSDELWMQENLLRNIGGTAVSLLDGVKNSVVISNSIVGVFEEFGAAMVLAGDPAPTGIVMRGNHFTDTFSPIFLGPGANNGFPAPEILNAQAPFTGTLTVNFSLRSTANPISYTYPLLMDLYRVRDGNYLPLGTNVMYDESAFSNVITYTSPIPLNSLLPGDHLAVIATTSNPNTSEFSDPVVLTPPPPDADDDGVPDGDDVCPGTVIPEANVPEVELGLNRFALVDGNLEFDTILPKGRGPNRGYTVAETGGCSCEQIISELGLGEGHSKFGCSISAMDDWVAGLSSVEKAGVAQTTSTPGSFALEQNYPNPFNPATTIVFQVSEQRHVTVRVFDMLGRTVATLVNEAMEPGTYRVEWDGRSAHGQPVTSGLYIYSIEAGDFSSAKTMILHR